MNLNIVFSRKLLYNEKTYYYHISKITDYNFAKFDDYFTIMFKNASLKDNKGVGGLEFKQRFETADNYYIAFISTNPKPEKLDDMIMSVGVSCWDDFPIYENRGITKNFNLSPEKLAQHTNLSLTLTSFTAYFMNAINKELYNQGYLFIYAWFTMAGIVYKILQDNMGWKVPTLYTPHDNSKLLHLCSEIKRGEINGIKFDAEKVLQKIKWPSQLHMLKNSDCPKIEAEHPIWIRIDELQQLYMFEEMLTTPEEEVRSRSPKQILADGKRKQPRKKRKQTRKRDK